MEGKEKKNVVCVVGGHRDDLFETTDKLEKNQLLRGKEERFSFEEKKSSPK